MHRPVVLVVAVASLVAAVVLTTTEVRQRREFRRLIATGDAATAHGQTVEAIAAFSGALALRRDSMLAHLRRGDAYRRRGELTAALRDLELAAALDPTAPQPAELLGDTYVAMEQWGRAVEHYRRYVALEDRAPRVLYKLAAAAYRSGDPLAAMDALRRALALSPRLLEAHHLLGLCLRDQRRVDEAIAEWTQAVGIDPAQTASREQLADVYLSLGRRREAIEQLEAIAALEPERVERLVALGEAYRRTGRIDAALVTFERAAERDPAALQPVLALGRLWIDLADESPDTTTMRKALGLLERAALRPDAPGDALAAYGHALLLSGRVDAAERTLEEATHHLPVDAVVFRDLATAATRLGHTEAAHYAGAQYAALTGN